MELGAQILAAAKIVWLRLLDGTNEFPNSKAFVFRLMSYFGVQTSIDQNYFEWVVSLAEMSPNMKFEFNNFLVVVNSLFAKYSPNIAYIKVFQVNHMAPLWIENLLLCGIYNYQEKGLVSAVFNLRIPSGLSYLYENNPLIIDKNFEPFSVANTENEEEMNDVTDFESLQKHVPWVSKPKELSPESELDIIQNKLIQFLKYLQICRFDETPRRSFLIMRTLDRAFNSIFKQKNLETLIFIFQLANQFCIPMSITLPMVPFKLLILLINVTTVMISIFRFPGALRTIIPNPNLFSDYQQKTKQILFFFKNFVDKYFSVASEEYVKPAIIFYSVLLE